MPIILPLVSSQKDVDDLENLKDVEITKWEQSRKDQQEGDQFWGATLKPSVNVRGYWLTEDIGNVERRLHKGALVWGSDGGIETEKLLRSGFGKAG
ncbi:hypothetical protein ABW20_dc0102357 [Dactylellina cionopaga]|nr:hypothetical protein ABW20_dc0102357 [Dactylellina cionopaga]